jgi:hypothetical protein
MWAMAKKECLYSHVKNELLAVFAPRRTIEPGQKPQPFPIPFADDTWLMGVVSCLVRQLPMERGELDEGARFRLLFPAGNGAPARVYNFDTSSFAIAAPGDRLLLHTKRPWSAFSAKDWVFKLL